MAMAVGVLGFYSSRNVCCPLPLEVRLQVRIHAMALGTKSSSGLGHPRGHRCRISTLSCFRSVTFEFVSSSRRVSEEFAIQNGGTRGVNLGTVLAQADSRYEREESHWVREEQRWLREEQRWQREEARWNAVNQALQEEVATLKEELKELRGQSGQGQITDSSLKNLVAGMRTLLQSLAAPDDSPPEKRRQIESSGYVSVETADAYTLERTEEAEIMPVTFVASPDKVVAVVTPNSTFPVISSPPMQEPQGTSKASVSPAKKRRTLKSGMEGDDVKELQDALAELGFHSGEEEMEFSNFSSGTARAVKTWQAASGIAENGLVSAELMEALLGEVMGVKSSKTEEGKTKVTDSISKPPEKVETIPESKYKVPSIGMRREINRYERTNAQETGSGSSRRVYLLGENRWEEPSRLIKKKEEKHNNGATVGVEAVVEKCFACRGEGTTLCTECEGTGDLNVEEQFLEWSGEDAKCPYCEGSGAVECDSCLGKGTRS